jgi:MOSC domain-containing protein YiiM
MTTTTTTAGELELAGWRRQADRKGHGGPEKAVLAYAAAHYDSWRARLELPKLPFGAFGENLTVAELTEQTVCIGDSWQLGGATVQISQPRVPCFKLAYRWRIKDLTARVAKTGRTGWYLRVLDEGEIQAGQEMTLLDRPYPQWTIARATEVERLRRSDHAAALELATCPLLNVAWRDWLIAEFDAARATPVARHA